MEIISASDIYEHIKSNIINFEYPPSCRLTENEIANKFNVSRTPVKVAFTRLENEGFLEVLPQRGTYVTKLNATKTKDFIYLRTCLEEKITIEFMNICTEQDCEILSKFLEEQTKTISKIDFKAEEFFVLDSKFHAYIFERTNHLGIWDEISKLTVNYTRYRMADLLESQNFNQLVKEHYNLFNAIKNKEEEKYKVILSQHLTGNFNKAINTKLKEYFY